MDEQSRRKQLCDKKRIVIKIGSSSLMHAETGKLDLTKIEKMIRILVDIKNAGKDVILVSSGAIAVGRSAVGLHNRPDNLPLKQACAAIGQAKLMMVYQRIFAEYGTLAAQVLLTKYTIRNRITRDNAVNTFEELLTLGAIPVVNENDSVSTEEIEQVQTFGDNDRLSAYVSSLVHADLLILLSDIDGMYTDDPKKNPQAKLLHEVHAIDGTIADMAKASSGSSVGTGGMKAKLAAAGIANEAGVDMVITNAENLDNIVRILQGEQVGTLFYR